MDNPLSLLKFAVFMIILVFGVSRPMSERPILRSDQVKNFSAEARLFACRSLIVKRRVLLGATRSNDNWSACRWVMRIAGRGGVGSVVVVVASAGWVWMVRWLA